MSHLEQCYNIADLREVAQRRLPKGVFEYLDRGSEDEVALAHNRRAYDRLKLRTRVLVDLGNLNTEVDLLGGPSALPLAIAPTGIAGLCSYEGELALAKAAAQAGVPFTLATGSITSMEKIAAEAGGRLWFQLYMWKEEELSYQLVQRAIDAGFEALVVTVDFALGNNREYNQRNGFSIPFRISPRSVMDMCRHPRWLVTVLGRYLTTTGMPRNENYPAKYQHRITSGTDQATPMRHSSMTWKDIARLRDFWPGKLIVKGILRAEDALLAVESGADAVVVSNHGGRNLDSSIASIDALPEIVSAVGHRATVILDSGIRRGSDIAKALALGADSVLIGRATLYGVSAGGQAGAERALAILRSELRKTMGYVGCKTVSDLCPELFEGSIATPVNGGVFMATDRDERAENGK
ncbi:alpha-hydroxy acid oxidase [Marinobacter sp. BSs20148]|jgi:(S)-mandelate dehydrogenase|uniref:alpha-hydroxy acid oxidase n=1 Tax=Marinobacter sp. BSs20148 TaxID=490759 RepID=UPI0002776886|nr:alpha-hydroxy acid oxidase [Marinobacter sp. BSs20148]AFP30230.1 (S)-mandelate dehydrogenase [Marinobacter sp. BSs20148]